MKKIIHIADLHIPNNVEESHYSDKLKNLISSIMKKIKNDNKEDVRIVIAGDIFHQKIKVNNEAMKMFHMFLNCLNDICKTFVFAGNHDLLENNTDRIDSITPTFEINGVYKNIVYVDKSLNYKSGYVVDDEIIWVLYSIFDKYSKPSIDIDKLKKEYPNHKIVGLYHGDIVGSVTDIGYTSEVGINTDIFDFCDCVMAGHIHKHQTIKKNGIPIVYAGSVFQRDFGENMTGHGFVLWTFEQDNIDYQLVEVKNQYRLVKFEIDDFDDVEQDNERILNL